MKRFIKKLLELKINALVVLFATSVLVYAASQNADGIYEFSSGDAVSSAQINNNFQVLLNRIKTLEVEKDPAGSVQAFYLATCPTGWKAADGTNSTPDLRGQFIRGLNTFGSTAGTRNDGKQDPEGGTRTIGSYQGDVFKSHRHGLYMGHSNIDNNQIFIVQREGTFSLNGYTSDNTKYSGNQYETRPRNMALIYCVKE